ncbi:MAG: ATP-binding protein [Rhodospirillales bacterium]|nr:ATP-binding protein [Rhodospirillales bacterium]
MISEIIINAIKHAHPSGVTGRLTVRCVRRTDGQLVIEVKDDGVGLPEGFDPASDGGLGLRLVQLLSRQLNATCRFDSTALGLDFRLEVPTRGRRVH